MGSLAASCPDNFPKNQAYSNQWPTWNWEKFLTQENEFPIDWVPTPGGRRVVQVVKSWSWPLPTTGGGAGSRLCSKRQPIRPHSAPIPFTTKN